MDRKRDNDDDGLVIQDLTPEQPANALQKSIIHLQRNWPPAWNKRHLLLLSAVLSSLVIFLLIVELIHPITQPNSAFNDTTNNNVAATINVSQMLSYGKSIYVIKTPIGSNVGTLEAINAQTGKLLWKYTHHNTEALKLLGNILYLQTDRGLVALNASNRTVLWEDPTFKNSSDWQIDGGLLFTRATNGIITALNARTGAQRWQFRQLNKFWAVDHGIFYVEARSAPGLTVLDANTGRLLWHNPTIYQDLTIDNGNVYLQNNITQRLESLDSRNGKIRWQFNIQGKDFNLVAQDGFLLLSDLAKTNVEALNGQTGKLIWQHQGILNGLTKSPNQTVISSLQNDETAIIRTTDGTILYHFPRSDAILSIENNIAFFINFFQSASIHPLVNNYITNIEAVSLSTGTTIWSNQSRAEFPLFQNNTIGIIPINGNSLLLLRDDNGRPIWQHSFDTTNN